MTCPASCPKCDSERAALIQNAIEELHALRSDIVSELGQSSSDLFLKASFIAYVDNIDLNLKKALIP